MQKDLTFIKTDDSWYIDLPNWVGPKHALLMVGGAHDILEDLSSKLGLTKLHIRVSTDEAISPYVLDRNEYTITGGAYYNFRGENDVWLCPVTLFVFGKYPKMISFLCTDKV